MKIYQGVTLGALSTRGGQKLKSKKRHPTIDDNVTIYHEHYKCFDAMPIAFTDIEMIFDEERQAVVCFSMSQNQK